MGVEGGETQWVLVEKNGCTGYDEIIIDEYPECYAAVPTAFSPNGDMDNDVLKVFSSGFSQLTFQVYNRYGALVFETNDPDKEWDGTFNGAKQEKDVYTYYLKAVCEDGFIIEKKGNITLLRQTQNELMRYFYYVSILLLVQITSVAQFVENPSFEGVPTMHTPPPSWDPCHFKSTPDTQPGIWLVNTPPSDGNSYMGMVTRGATGSNAFFWEDAQTLLLEPFKIGNCYSLSIDLALSAEWAHDSFAGWISYDNPVILRIFGSDQSCEKKELYWESPPVDHYDWQNYQITFSPMDFQADYLIIEVYYAQLPEYFGNMLLDNMQVSYLSLSPEVNLGQDTVICQNEDLILNAGYGYTSYLWQDGSEAPYFNVVQPGTYWVEVTNQMGCIGRDSIVIEIAPNPQVNLGNDTLICDGSNYLLDAGSGFVSYLWNDGSQTQTLVVDEPGNYWVEVSNQFGCSNIDSITIAFYANPTEFNLGNDTAFCTDTYFILNAGSGYTSYTWQDGSSDSVFITNQPGTYFVDVYNPCGENTDTIVLTNYPVFEADLGNDSILCNGDYLLLDPGLEFTSYLWQDGSTNQFYYTGQTGWYWVDVTDSNTCHNIDSVYLEFVLPDPALGNDTIMCPWDSITFYADSIFVSFLWHDNTTENFYIADTSGTYWCEVTDTMGCVGTDTVSLAILLPPNVNIGNDTSICMGDTIELNTHYEKYYHEFLWQDETKDSVLSINEEGIYWVAVTNVCGMDSDTLVLSLIELPYVFIGNDTVLALNDEIELDAGYGFEDYLWNTQSHQQTIVVSERGRFWVEVYDGVCYNSDSIQIDHVDCDVFIPIVFTPNWDHYNDYFFASGFNDIKDFNLTVFNRWGETIWETDRISLRWDGTRNGKDADTGTYFWVAQYKCTSSEQQFTKKGSVTLLR